jgi:hypothetical protein
VASGGFEGSGDPVSAGAWRLATGDFDGDGRADILTRSLPGASGLGKARIHFFDSVGALAAAGPVAGLLATPVVRDVDGDGRTDVLFGSLSGVGLLRGEAGRNLVPEVYATATLSEGVMRVISVSGFDDRALASLLFVRTPEFTGLVPITELSNGRPTLPTSKGPDDLAGQFAVAKFSDAVPARPCQEVAWAFRGEAEGIVFPVCRRDGGRIVWNDDPSDLVRIALPEGAVASDGVLSADVNGDGHLDLLIGAGARAYVAFGTGTGTFRENADAAQPGASNRASPFSLVVAGAPAAAPRPLPLAAGELNGDGVVDYVFGEEILLSTSVGAPGSPAYVRAFLSSNRVATVAAIADFNRDGFADVVVGSRNELDLTLFAGTQSRVLNPFTIATDGPVDKLTAGDVDGDLTTDLVVSVASGFRGSDRSNVSVAWGRIGQPLSAPTPVGSLGRTVQLAAVRTGRGVELEDIVVVFESSGGEAPDGGTAPKRSSGIAFIAGNGDRQPLAPLPLPGSLALAAPLGVAIGVFEPGTFPSVGAFAQAEFTEATKAEEPTRAWYSRALGPAAFGTPSAGPFFPAEVAPQAILGRNGQRQVATLVTAGDVTGDGVDELFVVAPVTVADGSQGELIVCTVQIVEGVPTFVPGTPLPLPFPISQEGQLHVEDVDGDGKPDVLLLTGSIGAGRRLLVLFNRGDGTFDLASGVDTTAGEEVPEGFAMVRTQERGPRTLAYVTSSRLTLLRFDGRAVAERTNVFEGRTLTGVAAGDVNGDGIEDLAMADEGNLVVLLGKAVLQ